MLQVPGGVRAGPRLDGSGDFGVRSPPPDGSKMLLVQRGVRLVQRNGRALRRTSNIFQPAGRDEGTPTSPFRSSRWTGRTLPRTINLFQPSCQSIGVKVQRQRPVARLIDNDNLQGLSTSGHIRYSHRRANVTTQWTGGRACQTLGLTLLVFHPFVIIWYLFRDAWAR